MVGIGDSGTQVISFEVICLVDWTKCGKEKGGGAERWTNVIWTRACICLMRDFFTCVSH